MATGPQTARDAHPGPLHPRYRARVPNTTARRPALPPSLAGAGFTVADARALGVSPGRLRSADLAAPFHGLRTIGAPDGQLGLARAYSTRMSSHHAFGGATAAAVLGLPFARERLDSTEIDVVGPRSASRVRRRGVRMRRVLDRWYETVELDGMRVVAPPLLLAMLAGELPEHELVAVVEALITDAGNYPGLRFADRPWTSLDALAQVAERYTGMRGAEALPVALARARVGAESPMETYLRLRLVDAGLPEPEANVEIRLPSGRTVRPDLAYRADRVLIDYEGDHHRTDPATWFDDIERVREIVACGYDHVRVTRNDFRQDRFAAVVEHIQRRLS